jgi:hypothetical protein
MVDSIDDAFKFCLKINVCLSVLQCVILMSPILMMLTICICSTVVLYSIIKLVWPFLFHSFMSTHNHVYLMNHDFREEQHTL